MPWEQACSSAKALLCSFAPRGTPAPTLLISWQVSEGIDFSDDMARMCVIVGIPYPNTKDLQVWYRNGLLLRRRTGVSPSSIDTDLHCWRMPPDKS